MLVKIKNAVDYINNKIQTQAKIGIVLGSGLSGLTKDVHIRKTLLYEEIPHFPVSTVAGHEGKLLAGNIHHVEVLIMQGRFHYYEGYDMKEVTFPIRVMRALGIDTLILSNASGGINPDYKIGDIVFITDHINFFPEHPLRGKNENAWGIRFPDMNEVYSKELIAKAEQVALDNNIKYQKGIYAGTQGPAYETPAEYRMFRFLGGDCVGMSTVPEAIVARHANMRCVAFSIITDMGVGDMVEKISHKEVLKAARQAEPTLSRLIRELVLRIY
ncbi:MAG: purine-nucleoside phosphorylase [Bacteroidales bacterium]|jgi:purine-nucleoside phosphorylase|nr:purine-nucleoside phosphorylase [Bacteroidales bacterium]